MSVNQKSFPASPLELITPTFTPDRILSNDRGFVIASGTWTEKDTGYRRRDQLACRFHEQDKLGYPNGGGHPQWMRLGNMTLADAELTPLAAFGARYTLNVQRSENERICGGWVKAGGDWHLVNYIDISTTTIMASGRGKRNSYPLPISEVEETAQALSVMGAWHAKHPDGWFIWADVSGMPFVTHVCSSDQLIDATNTGNVIERYSVTISLLDSMASVTSDGYSSFDMHFSNCALLGIVNDDFEGRTIPLGKIMAQYKAKQERLKLLYGEPGKVTNEEKLELKVFLDEVDIEESEYDRAYGEGYYDLSDDAELVPIQQNLHRSL